MEAEADPNLAVFEGLKKKKKKVKEEVEIAPETSEQPIEDLAVEEFDFGAKKKKKKRPDLAEFESEEPSSGTPVVAQKGDYSYQGKSFIKRLRSSHLN